MNKFLTREQGLCYVKDCDLGGTVEQSLFIEKELNSVGGGCELCVSVCVYVCVHAECVRVCVERMVK